MTPEEIMAAEIEKAEKLKQ